jgi:flagellar biosynthesis component FlhA
VLLTSSTLRKHVAQLMQSLGDKRNVLAMEEIPAGTVTVDKVAVVERRDA